jgi:DNA-binding CsgD family transcriptional regulator
MDDPGRAAANSEWRIKLSRAGQVLHGLSAVNDAIYDDAVRGSTIMTVFPDLPPDMQPALRPERARIRDYDDHLVRLGVRTYAVVTQGRSADAALMDYLNADPLTSVRVAKAVPTRFLIVDDRVAFVALSSRHYTSGALRVTEPGLVAAMLGTWSDLRRRAVAVEQVDVEVALTDLERGVLSELGRGATDAVAARRLNVSERTVARTISSLMRRLNCHSRFGLGVASARHHLL